MSALDRSAGCDRNRSAVPALRHPPIGYESEIVTSRTRPDATAAKRSLTGEWLSTRRVRSAPAGT
jgi:hypothetical protein